MREYVFTTSESPSADDDFFFFKSLFPVKFKKQEINKSNQLTLCLLCLVSIFVQFKESSDEREMSHQEVKAMCHATKMSLKYLRNSQ